IISDVVGDPLDVIASGPTAPDPSTFADALNVLRKYHLLPVSEQTQDDPTTVPLSVVRYLEKGLAGEVPETPKSLPAKVHNRIIGSNANALAAASAAAESLGYHVLNIASKIEGETTRVAA